MAQKLLELLLQPPSEELRNELFALVVEMKDLGVTQSQAAQMLKFASAVWSQKKLGEQSARLEPLRDAIQIVSGFDGAPSPLYDTILDEAIPNVPAPDPIFVAACKQAANAVAQYHGNKIVSLEAQQAAMQRELDLLLAEASDDEGDIDDGVAADNEDDDENVQLKKSRHEHFLREEAEKEFAALQAEEALLKEMKN